MQPMRNSPLAVLAANLVLFFSLGSGQAQLLSEPIAESPSCVAAPDGLVGWWTLEGTGSDSAGDNDASLTNVPFTSGKVGEAADFNGSTSMVTVPASSNLAVRSLTIEGWINPRNISVPRPILEYSKMSGGLGTVQLWYGFTVGGPGGAVTAPGGLYGLLRGTNGTALQVGSVAGILPSNQWTHVAMTFDYDSRVALIYANGALVASNQSAVPMNVDTLVPVHIGYRPSGSAELLAGRRHDGLLDEVSIYGRALAGDEIAAVYQADVAGKCPPPPACNLPDGLVSWWRGDGDTMDELGANHGTAMGNVTYVPGKVGQGFYLNGAGSYIRVPASASLSFSNEFTVEFWYQSERAPSANNAEGLVAKRNSESGPLNYEISLVPGTRVDAFYNDPTVIDTDNAGSVFELSRYPSAPPSGGFHHLAATYRQATANSVEIRTFVDGQLVRTRVLAGNLSRTVNDAPVLIGASVEYPTYEYFKGIIDEISLYFCLV